MWSASEELPTPARPRPQVPGHGPPPPAAAAPLPARPAPTHGANRLWNRGIARARARAGPRRAAGEGRAASPGKASERGGEGGGGGEGLEPVLRKTGPRTKRNPRCELVDRRRLLPRRRSRCHLRTPPRVFARSVPRSGSGDPEVTSARAPRPHAPPRPERPPPGARGRRRGCGQGGQKGSPSSPAPTKDPPTLRRSRWVPAGPGVFCACEREENEGETGGVRTPSPTDVLTARKHQENQPRQPGESLPSTCLWLVVPTSSLLETKPEALVSLLRPLLSEQLCQVALSHSALLISSFSPWFSRSSV